MWEISVQQTLLFSLWKVSSSFPSSTWRFLAGEQGAAWRGCAQRAEGEDGRVIGVSGWVAAAAQVLQKKEEKMQAS